MRLTFNGRDWTNLALVIASLSSIGLLWVLGYYSTNWMHTHDNVVPGRTDPIVWVDTFNPFAGMLVIILTGAGIFGIVSVGFFAWQGVKWIWPRRMSSAPEAGTKPKFYTNEEEDRE